MVVSSKRTPSWQLAAMPELEVLQCPGSWTREVDEAAADCLAHHVLESIVVATTANSDPGR